MKISFTSVLCDISLSGINKEQYFYLKLIDNGFNSITANDKDLQCYGIENIGNIAYKCGLVLDSCIIQVTNDEGLSILENNITCYFDQNVFGNIHGQVNNHSFKNTKYKYGVWALGCAYQQTIENKIPDNQFDIKLLKIYSTRIEGISIISKIKYNKIELNITTQRVIQ